MSAAKMLSCPHCEKEIANGKVSRETAKLVAATTIAAVIAFLSHDVTVHHASESDQCCSHTRWQ